MIAEAITQLLSEGKIKAFGVSNFLPAQIALLETEIAVSGNQLEFSLTANSVMNDGSLDDCQANNRTLMSWSPLGSYFREDNEQTLRISTVLSSMMEKYNLGEIAHFDIAKKFCIEWIYGVNSLCGHQWWRSKGIRNLYDFEKCCFLNNTPFFKK